MLPFKRILFPVDFSPQSTGAARFVQAFAGRFDSEIVLLHVIELPHYNDLMPESPGQKRAHLQSFLARELEYFHVERVAREGDAAEQIVRVAREKHVDLIMMPTHARAPIRRFLLGSVTAKILHDADCPVWTGGHLESAPPLEKIELHRLLCAINAQSQASTVLACAREFAAEYKAELTVLHVPESANSRAAVEKLTGDSEVIYESGEVPHVVGSVASRISADLLVIGRSASPGVFGRLRTHSYPIIRQSHCPVISV